VQLTFEQAHALVVQKIVHPAPVEFGATPDEPTLTKTVSKDGYGSGNNASPLRPMLLVYFGYCGITEHFGLRKALEESANRIIRVPPGHGHNQACQVAEARKEVVRKPMPNLVASGLAVRLRSALDWIIHDSKVQTLTGDLAFDSGVLK